MRRMLTGIVVLVASLGFGQTRVKDVIYLKQGGCAYTMDVFKPKASNHKALVWMVSGGWISNHESINPEIAKAYNDRGFTVFQVVHGTQPKFTIMEIVPQVRRAIRYIHANAAEFDIDPNAIGVFGASAGGHLSLEIGGLGDDGNPSAKDPVERASSRVNTVVAFMPPTDFENWGSDGTSPFGVKQMEPFYPAFGVNNQTPKDVMQKIAHDVSPIQLVKAGFPPTLIIHGDKDMLVPIQQAQRMDTALEAAKIEHKLVISQGSGHDIMTYLKGLQPAIEWFSSHLVVK